MEVSSWSLFDEKLEFIDNKFRFFLDGNLRFFTTKEKDLYLSNGEFYKTEIESKNFE